jgi:hypothetical protein
MPPDLRSRGHKNKLAVSFNHRYRYIDVLAINNSNFHNYVHLIYPDELEIKVSVSCLDILLHIDYNGRLTTTLYDMHDDFNLFISTRAIFRLYGGCHHYR